MGGLEPGPLSWCLGRLWVGRKRDLEVGRCVPSCVPSFVLGMGEDQCRVSAAQAAR